MNTEERMIDLEIRLARQDDLLDVLNSTVYRQQEQIAQLEALCTELARRVKEVASGNNERGPANERPPHY